MIQQEKWKQRQERILLRLDKLTYATREQLQVIENLGGDRNAHRILHRMEKDKAIKSIRAERKIYFLSNRGKEQIGSKQGELKRSWITHTLMRNDLYIMLGQPKDWRKEVPINFNADQLIPDAMFKRDGKFHFVEIDNEQAMRTNYDKIKKYKELERVILGRYKHKPTLIWYTLSSARKEKLQEACEKAGIQFKIY